jgi:hypothetical protein
MRKFIQYVIAAITLIFIFSFTPKKTQHVGIWKGVDHGQTGYFTFDSSGFASIEIEGQVLGGRTFQQNGITAQMTYVVDYETKPIGIDLIVTIVESNEEALRARGIIEFISADKMKISLDLNSGVRPTGFTKENTIVLIKEK